jgi:hypothetical protein
MGYTFNDLVAPAVLFDNPGITREEFVMLLDETHSSFIHEYKENDAWDYYTKFTEDKRFHEGLKGLASILGLGYSQEFIRFKEPRKDENGFSIRGPNMYPAPDGASHKFDVYIHEKTIFEEPKLVEASSWDKLKIGSVWEETMMGSERGIVLEVLDESEFEQVKDDFCDSAGPQFYYRMRIRPFYAELRVEHFNSEQELYDNWPEFHPDFVYDWSKTKGSFGQNCFGRENFLWDQEQGKYSLDRDTLNRIPASFRCSGRLGFADLVLTSEAIKHKAWKVLSYKGLQHFPQFLKNFPDVVDVYSRAVWDSHTSLSARLQGLTISDFLRFRVLP